MTSYQLAAFATHVSAGVGVAPPAPPLTVLQPFFITATLPPVATRGETFSVAATVFNYGSAAVTATVALAASSAGLAVGAGDGGLRESTPPSVTLAVPPGGTAGATFYVKAAGLGPQLLMLSARTPAAVGLADATELQITLVPEGLPVTSTQNALLQLAANGSGVSQQTVIFDTAPPAGVAVVPGSVLVRLSVVGDVMGPTISGLVRGG